MDLAFFYPFLYFWAQTFIPGGLAGAIGLLVAPWFLAFARKYTRSVSREMTPTGHQAKNSIPTMGGLLIIGLTLAGCLIYIDRYNAYVWICLLTLLSFGILGAIDDWFKITVKKGIFARTKFIGQIVLACMCSLCFVYFLHPHTSIYIPVIRTSIEIGYFFIPWCMLILISTANAVNITDGLDGLATGCLIPNFIFYAIIAHFMSLGSLGTLCSILIGSCIVFLTLNRYPAQLFMGDVGSLALGATLGMIALMLRLELLLIISGSIFVIETISDIIQVGSLRLRGKRVFAMAPIHHHFELHGYHETHITRISVIITIITCIISYGLL